MNLIHKSFSDLFEVMQEDGWSVGSELWHIDLLVRIVGVDFNVLNQTLGHSTVREGGRIPAMVNTLLVGDTANKHYELAQLAVDFRFLPDESLLVKEEGDQNNKAENGDESESELGATAHSVTGNH